MGITIKKKKITLKAPAAGSPPENPPEPKEPEAPVEAEDDIPDEEEEVIAPSAQKSDGASYTLAAILAMVAIVLFISLLVLQLMEMSYYKSPPNAFPIITATAPMGRPAATVVDDEEDYDEDYDEEPIDDAEADADTEEDSGIDAEDLE